MKKIIFLFSLFAALILGVNGQTKLVGHYKFDHSGADTVAVDATGNGNDLILTDSMGWEEGVIDSAFSFHGSKAYTDAADLFQVQSLTIATYLRINPSISDANYVLSIGDNCGLWVRPDDGAIRFYIHALTVLGSDSSGSWVGVYGTKTDIRDGYWHHVAVTFDTTDLVATVYVDGDTIVSDTVRNAGSGLAPMAHHSQIWYQWDGFSLGATGSRFYLMGSLDDTRFYSGKLSPPGIKDLIEPKYPIATATEGDGKVSPPDGSSFNMSDTIQFMAVPGPGNFFKSWAVGTDIINDNPMVIKEEGKPIKVTATFGSTLIAKYHFDEGNDTIVSDASGNNNELAMNEPSWGNDGVVNGCFNPAATVEAMALDDTPFRRQAFTFVSYVRVKPGMTGASYLMTQGDNYGLWVRDDGAVRFYAHALTIQGSDSTDSWVGTNAESVDMRDGLWHQLAVTFDTTDLVATIYVDGEIVASDTVRNSGTGLAPALHHSQIWYKWDGYFVGGGTGKFIFNGSVDEVEYYSKRLSGNEIKELLVDRYELSVKTTGHGSVTPADGMYFNNDTLNLLAVPDAGSKFLLWVYEDNSTSADNPLHLVVDKDMVLTAEFASTLVANYKFDQEGSDTIAVDASDNGLDLTLKGSYEWSDAGVADGCLNTGGASEAVTDDDSMFRVQTLTFAAYLRVNPANTTANYIMSQGDNYGLWILDNGGLRFYVHALTVVGNDSAGSWVGTNAPDYNLKDGLWHHVAVTFDTTDLVATLYVDGDTVASDTVRNSGSGLAPLAHHSQIWLQWDGFKLTNSMNNGLYFDGSIDDARFYSIKLGSEDIAALVAERYSLTTSVTGNGTVSPAEGMFYRNDTLMLTAVADDGWIFDKWDSTSTVWGTDNPITVTVAGNVMANAVFKESTGIKDVSLSGVNIYPSPFDATVTISYDLEQAADVNISVYNTVGQCVAVLVKEREMAGKQTVTWNGTGVEKGLYFIRIRLNDQVNVRKVVKR